MDQDQGGEDTLRDVKEAASRVAREAADSLDENVRAMHGGQETDYDFRLPPDMAEADRVRGADDVDLMNRQADIAEAQRQAAQLLQENAERLRQTGQELQRTESAVRDNRGDVGDIRENVRALGDQLSHARDRVARTEVPRVDGPADGSGDGDADARG
jgi:ABC-type transporter Mla subunit MlaD